MIARYTLVVTSCNRHDLLRTTLESFIDTCDEAPIETVVIEDSDAPTPEWWAALKLRLGWRATWLSNGTRMGQIYSADRAMQWVIQNCKTEYVFWLEDDWRFTRAGYIEPSLEILSKYPTIITVAVRSEWNHPAVTVREYPFPIAEPYWGGEWGGFAFNPGLRRVSDYRAMQSFGRITSYNTNGLTHEKQLSLLLLDQGFRIAILSGGGHCHHIGDGRSRSTEALPERPRILIAVPACHELKYGRWESAQSPQFDRANPAYGDDIHISGPNTRIAAVRDSWWKDVATHSAHVDAKFFYGVSEKQDLFSDEVMLRVPDDYAHLPHKSQAIARYAYEHGYQYVFKCDDDTFVWVDRLVAEGIAARWDYAGNLSCGLALGGAGYWLSRRAMKAVADAGAPDHWAEDMWVGKVVTNAGMTGQQLPHYSGVGGHYADLTRIPEDAVTIHAVRPEDMRKINGNR